MNAPPLYVAVAEAGGAKGAELLAHSFYRDSRVRKIIGSVVASSGLSFAFRDDLLQETYSVLQGYVGSGRVTNPSGIYSLVYASAFNCARTIRNQEAKNGANVVLPTDDDDGGTRAHDIVDESTSSDRGDAVDIIRARNKIACILKAKQSENMQQHPLIANAEPLIRVANPVQNSPKAPARQLSPAQQELSSIIADLGYKHEEFASDIGIGMSRLASYLYGRTTTVPDHIMDRARELKTQASPVVERWKKAYDKPMPEIIAAWEKALGLTVGAKGNDDIIAAVLEVNPVTVYRWRKQDTSPQMHSIAKMDGRIRAEVQRIARRAKGRSRSSANKS